MKLITLGSSSSGNCYLLKGSKETLILEAGIKPQEVKKALDFNLSNVVGCLASHRHGDHSRYVHEYAKVGIPVLAPVDVFAIPHNRNRPVQPGKGYKLGEFKVIPFKVQHDVPCYGYQIDHPEMGRLIFLTDTYLSEYTFPGVNHLMLEVNYADDILEENIINGSVHPSMRNRLMTTHMELETAKGLLAANDLRSCTNIFITHLSSGNSHQERFVEEITAATGKKVWAADRGLEVDLNVLPF